MKFSGRFPCAQVPILEVDGVTIFQSRAIENFLSRKFGFHGSNDIEAAQIEGIVEQIRDIRMATRENFNGGDAKKAEWLAENGGLCKHFALLEKYLEKGKNGYFVGGKLSFADILAFHLLGGAWEMKDLGAVAPVFAKYPRLCRLKEQVFTLDSLRAYVAHRDQPKIKSRNLTYFPLRGRAETIRLMAAYCGCELTETSIEFKDWMGPDSPKSKTPLGYLPILTLTFDDGHKAEISESLTILKLFARNCHKGYGATLRELAKTDMITEWANNFRNPKINSAYLYVPHFNKDAAKRAAFVKDDLPGFIAQVEKFLDEAKSGFLVCAAPTFADIFVFDTLEVIEASCGASTFAAHPKITAFLGKVRGVDGIAAYIAKRKPLADFAPPA
jgi:glutathione S-transferase